MARVVWTRPALDDLRDVYQFIARDSHLYARTTVEGIRATVRRRVERFPTSGRVVPEHLNSLYREIVVGSYRAIYRYDEERDVVLVVAVVHGSRQLPPIVDGPA